MITLTEHCAKNQLDYYKERDAAIRGERPNIFQHDGRWYANEGECDQLRIEQPDPFDGFVLIGTPHGGDQSMSDAYALLERNKGSETTYVVLSIDADLAKRIIARFGERVAVMLRGDGALLLTHPSDERRTRKVSQTKRGRRGQLSLGRNVGALAFVRDMGTKYHFNVNETYADGKAVLFVPRGDGAA